MTIEELLEKNGYYLAFQWDNISQGEKLFVGKNNKTICDLEYFYVDILIKLRNKTL